MSKAQVIFIFNGMKTIIPCKANEKIINILERFSENIEININQIYCLYNGSKVNIKLKFEELINSEDKLMNIMNILIYEINNYIDDNIHNNTKMSKGKIYKDNISAMIKDYKINFDNCKNIKINKFEKKQKKDISKVLCFQCKGINKGNEYKNEFYRFTECNKNICPICKSINDINNDKKDYIYNKYKEGYIKYYNECKMNLCMKCENENNNHNEIYFKDILQNQNDELKNYIDKLNNEVKEIINKLKEIMKNLEIYYKISNNYINNRENRNYEILQKMNQFIDYNKEVIKEIKEIINDNNIENKFKKIININQKMQYNRNFILGEIDIEEENINKDIRIINSFEEYKRKEELEVEEDDYKYENEKEITDNCIIEINNEIIPFNYFYKFNRKGKYKIKYSFIKNINKTDYMFNGCESLINLNFSHFNSENVTKMKRMFTNCGSLTNLNLSNFNTENITDMSFMFTNCGSLTNLNLSNFNTKNVTDMSFMFENCKSLTNLNLSNFNTENVTNMKGMFSKCESLNYLNLSNFNIQYVTDISFMFSFCGSLTHLNLINFKTDNVTNMEGMFFECKSLIDLNISNFKTQNVNNMENMFDGCKSLKYLNLSNFNTQKIINMLNMLHIDVNELQRLNISLILITF